MSYKLNKPYTENQRADFIVEYNHRKGLLIEETEEGLIAKEPPQPSLDELATIKRSERDIMLKATDVYMLIDFPISDEERELYKQYRQYLRDLPADENFPDVEVMNFEEWSQWIGD